MKSFLFKKKKKEFNHKKMQVWKLRHQYTSTKPKPVVSLTYRTINTKSVNSNLRYAERCKEPFFFVFAWNKGILSLQEKKDYNNKEKEKHLKNTLKDTR